MKKTPTAVLNANWSDFAPEACCDFGGGILPNSIGGDAAGGVLPSSCSGAVPAPVALSFHAGLTAVFVKKSRTFHADLAVFHWDATQICTSGLICATYPDQSLSFSRNIGQVTPKKN